MPRPDEREQRKKQSLAAKLGPIYEGAGEPLPPPSPVRQLCQDGVWLIPPSDRPKGWEAWGLKELVQGR